MPANLSRLALGIAPFHEPDVLPGVPDMQFIRLKNWILYESVGLRSSNLENRFIFGILLAFIPVLFLPGWAYRIILKSTLWLWWILFFIGGAPNIIGGVNGLRADAYRKWWAWIAIALSLLTLGGLLFAPWIRAVIASKQGVDPMPVSIALLFLINWRAVSVFQGLALLTSALTLLTVLWAQSLAVDHAEVPGREESVNRQLPWVGYVIKLKTGLGFASIALTMAYIALYFNAVEWNHPVSAYAYNWLVWLYGLNAPALLPVGAMRV